jgi:hypothetical protein
VAYTTPFTTECAILEEAEVWSRDFFSKIGPSASLFTFDAPSLTEGACLETPRMHGGLGAYLHDLCNPNTEDNKARR